MEHNPAADSRAAGDGRTVFERFVEHTHRRVSPAPFFIFCAGIVAVWLISYPLWTDLKVIATALAALMESGARDDPELRDASQALREAVGLEERH